MARSSCSGFEDSECTTVCPLTTQSMVLRQGAASARPGPRCNSSAWTPTQTRRPCPTCSPTPGRMAWSTSGTSSPGRPRSSRRSGSTYHIEVQVDQGQIDHTPGAVRHRPAGAAAEGLPDSDGVLERRPVRPGRGARRLLAAAPATRSWPACSRWPPSPGQGPTARVSLPAAPRRPLRGATVALGPGKPRPRGVLRHLARRDL